MVGGGASVDSVTGLLAAVRVASPVLVADGEGPQMPNYIDLYSLGPTDTLATLRVQLLNLSGTLLPRNARGNALYALRRGDSITCMPSAYPYWRRLSSDIPIVNAEDTSVEDDPHKRVDSWLQWWLVALDLSVGDATALMRSPPKTNKHKYWVTWAVALGLADQYNDRRVELMLSSPLCQSTKSMSVPPASRVLCPYPRMVASPLTRNH